MYNNPSFQPTPLRSALQIAFVSLTVVVSLFFFLATIKQLVLRGGQRPDLPLPLPLATHTPSPSPTPSWTATPLPTSTPAFTPTPTLPPTPTPLPGTVRVIDPSGLKAAYVPGGKFRIGDPNGGGNDSPRHAVILPSFWMGRTQVTNAQYAACVAAGGCTKPIRKQINPRFYDPKYANHPTVYITWDQAQAFCTWAGGSLPTEAQWERAAGKGPYPWGEREPASYFTNVNHPKRGTVEVGKNPRNASPYGVLDMGSNVREWVADWYGERYYRTSPTDNPTGPESGDRRVLRGAAWYDPDNFSLIWHRLAHAPGSAGANRGFRCAFP